MSIEFDDQLEGISHMFERGVEATTQENLKKQKLIRFVGPSITPKRIDGAILPNLRKANELEIQRYAKARGAYGYSITTLIDGYVDIKGTKIPIESPKVFDEQNSPITYINGAIVELSKVTKDKKWRKQAKEYLNRGITKGVLFVENKKSRNPIPAKLFPLREGDKVIII